MALQMTMSKGTGRDLSPWKEEIRDAVRHNRFDSAAIAINERYRADSRVVLGVFEDLLTALSAPTARGDARTIGHLLKICRPPERVSLKEFIGSSRAQNCLAAVIKSLEKQIPAAHRMGLYTIADFFINSDYFAIYQEDIVHYEPLLSALTDDALSRLLSAQPNRIDLGLLDRAPLRLRDLLLRAYEQESVVPTRAVFFRIIEKCETFLRDFEEFAGRFRTFYDEFRDHHFTADEETFDAWRKLGQSYFRLEVSKSSLMLPIRPPTLHRGMRDVYPSSLEMLTQLRHMVTPDFDIQGPAGDEAGRLATISLRNPGTLKNEAFRIEPIPRFLSSGLAEGARFDLTLSALEPNRVIACRIHTAAGAPAPLLSIRITCEAKYYSAPFVIERRLELKEPRTPG